MASVDLVIFTCEGREQLLKKTYDSFRIHAQYDFDKVVLAIDGKVDPNIIEYINPDVIVQHRQRKGYVNNIATVLSQLKSSYFFWLEDDWKFHRPIEIQQLANMLETNLDWTEIILSKSGPLTAEEKIKPLSGQYFETIYGFSANPCICRTTELQDAFIRLEKAQKGDQLGEDGFENFLTKTFGLLHKKCVILDPIEGQQLSHEGYLESTPRNWHMTNSLESRTKTHLLTMPKPSFLRRISMAIKILVTLIGLGIRQFYNDKVYEFCFRIVASAKEMTKKEE